MPTSSGSRWAIDKPLTPDAVSQLRLSITSLIEKAEAVGALIDRGTEANQPVSTPGSPGIVGRFYIVSDQANRLDYDYGTGWVTLTATKTLLHPLVFTRGEDATWDATNKEAGRFPVQLYTGQTCTLDQVQHVLASGSGTTFKLQRSTGGGAFADITGYTALAPTTTADTTDAADVTLSSGDWIRLVVTAQGTGKGGAVAVFLRETV